MTPPGGFRMAAKVCAAVARVKELGHLEAVQSMAVEIGSAP